MDQVALVSRRGNAGPAGLVGSGQHYRNSRNAGMSVEAVAVNKQRGEREVQIGDKTYIAVMDLNAMAKLESHWTGIYGNEVTFDEVMQKAGKGSITHIVSAIWASLLRHQPDVTTDDVAVLTLPEMRAINATLTDSMVPDSEDRKKGPRKAQVNGAAVGTGETSKSTRDASA